MKKKNEKEKCVSCEKETNVPKNLNIDFRKNYVEGAGQLCDECHDKIYGKK
jgi:hypothetical protein